MVRQAEVIMVSQADVVPALQGRGAWRCFQDYPYGWGCGLLPPAIDNIELGCGMFWNESVMQPPHSSGRGGGVPQKASQRWWLLTKQVH